MAGLTIYITEQARFGLVEPVGCGGLQAFYLDCRNRPPAIYQSGSRLEQSPSSLRDALWNMSLMVCPVLQAQSLPNITEPQWDWPSPTVSRMCGLLRTSLMVYV